MNIMPPKTAITDDPKSLAINISYRLATPLLSFAVYCSKWASRKFFQIYKIYEDTLPEISSAFLSGFSKNILIFVPFTPLISNFP